MSRETRLNIRITPEFQEELKAIAAYYGLTVSSYVHSTLVRKLREEREATPDAFEVLRRHEAPTPNGKIAGVITPGERSTTKADVRRDYAGIEDTIATFGPKLNIKNSKTTDDEEGTERDDSRVSAPRKRAGGR
jgi:antitoxin component of RelBE/YafQ-DinJ toxin-antitoxin module